VLILRYDRVGFNIAHSHSTQYWSYDRTKLIIYCNLNLIYFSVKEEVVGSPKVSTNVWKERQEFYNSARPKNEDEESYMLQLALEESQRQEEMKIREQLMWQSSISQLWVLTHAFWITLQFAHLDMHHLVFGINFQIHSVSLTSLVSIHLLIHLSTYLSRHPCSHHPSLLHSLNPGSKPTFSTSLSHLRLLYLLDCLMITGLDRTYHAHQFNF